MQNGTARQRRKLGWRPGGSPSTAEYIQGCSLALTVALFKWVLWVCVYGCVPLLVHVSYDP